jgi:hypothetical protein
MALDGGAYPGRGVIVSFQQIDTVDPKDLVATSTCKIATFVRRVLSAQIDTLRPAAARHDAGPRTLPRSGMPPHLPWPAMTAPRPLDDRPQDQALDLFAVRTQRRGRLVQRQPRLDPLVVAVRAQYAGGTRRAMQPQAAVDLVRHHDLFPRHHFNQRRRRGTRRVRAASVLMPQRQALWRPAHSSRRSTASPISATVATDRRNCPMAAATARAAAAPFRAGPMNCCARSSRCRARAKLATRRSDLAGKRSAADLAGRNQSDARLAICRHVFGGAQTLRRH